MLSHEGDMYITRSSQVSRAIEEGAERPENILGRIRVKQYFPGLGVLENCFHDIIAAVVAVKGLPRVKSVTSSIQRWTGL